MKNVSRSSMHFQIEKSEVEQYVFSDRKMSGGTVCIFRFKKCGGTGCIFRLKNNW